MAVKIRLARMGRHKRPSYRIVVMDFRSPRNGRAIEVLGAYDPLTNPATVAVDRDRALQWLKQGAQMSDTARRILQKSGVLS